MELNTVARAYCTLITLFIFMYGFTHRGPSEGGNGTVLTSYIYIQHRAGVMYVFCALIQ